MTIDWSGGKPVQSACAKSGRSNRADMTVGAGEALSGSTRSSPTYFANRKLEVILVNVLEIGV
jgi:hypothetical protein